MTIVEVHDVEVIDFDKARAQSTLRKLDAAMQTWTRSTVELSDLAYEARRDQCWRVDEEFAAARASGAIAPDSGGNWDRAWLGWRFNRSARTVRDLADYGELRAIIAADPRLPQIAEPESAARPLGKLLRPRYLRSEVIDVEEHHEAIRQVWRDAIELTENGTPAEAIKAVSKALKRTDFKPLKRLLTKSENQKSAERQATIAKARKAMTDSAYTLLRLGAVDLFDEAMAELTEARKR